MLIKKHGAAIDYDLMTRTPYTIEDVPEELSWAHLLHFVQHLDVSSALVRDSIDKELVPWVTGENISMLLADLIDAVQSVQWTVSAAHSKRGSKPPRPKPYPRPNSKKKKYGGNKPVPIDEFDKFWSSPS